MVEAKVSFLAPAPKAFVPAAVLAGWAYRTATPAEFAAERDRAQPEARRGHYRLSEDTMTITGPRKRDPSYTVRRWGRLSPPPPRAAPPAPAPAHPPPRHTPPPPPPRPGPRPAPTTAPPAAPPPAP